jgi:DNA-binding GntR family transcriptional regulator
VTTSAAGRVVQRPAPYSEQAAQILREEILAGAYEPGERLNEVELSSKLGISRSPIREGMRKLADEGLVVLAPRRGAFVASFAPDEIGELMEFRQAIDVMAARLAAARATSEQLEQMQVALEAATVAHRGAASAAPPWGSDFHILILHASGNRKIVERGTEVHTQLHLARFRSGSTSNRAQEAHDEHQEILDRIAARDAEGAGDAMWRHLDRATMHIRDIVGGARTTPVAEAP